MKARKKKYAMGGKLTPKQKKLDKNKDGKISGKDFKMMKKGGKLYKDGGKVKGLLKGLEGMPDRKGRKLPKDLPVIGRDRFDMNEFVEGNPFFSRSAQASAAKAMKAKRAAKGISPKK